MGKAEAGLDHIFLSGYAAFECSQMNTRLSKSIPAASYDPLNCLLIMLDIKNNLTSNITFK